ncbi:MAG: hypothetical protein DME36_07730, partial [Verrucomicrobia bacterium]
AYDRADRAGDASDRSTGYGPSSLLWNSRDLDVLRWLRVLFFLCVWFVRHKSQSSFCFVRLPSKSDSHAESITAVREPFSWKLAPDL